MFVIVSYDITDDKRRNRVAKTMKLFGDRVQYSVFDCNLEPEEMVKMISKLSAAINEDEDSIRLYTLCANCVDKVQIIGQGGITEDPDLIVI